ncbi:MAG TPA: HlyD family efflux transporter periplasmic adaptor subunit [Clostridiaceae bacterium]|nr:HlyD family efflux transporter periplasmic adaptor subunit [Clostridiaceae bacterium]
MNNVDNKAEYSPGNTELNLDRREKAASEMKERRKKKTRRRRIVLVISFLATVAVLVFFFTRDQKDLPKVRTEIVKTGKVVETIGLSPYLQPARIQSVVGADVPIREIYVEIGTQVQAGERLFSYDISDLETELEKTRELILETEESIKTAASEAEDLSSQLGMLSSSQIDTQIESISSSLSRSIGGLASQMVDIQAPFLELGQMLEMVDVDSINTWVSEMQSLTSELRQRLDFLEEQGTLDDLASALQRLRELEQNLNDLELEFENTKEWQEWLENNLPPGITLPGSSTSNSESSPTTIEDTNSENTENNQNSSPTGEGSGGAASPDLTSLTPETLQQLQQMLGGTGNAQMLTSGLNQGQDLLKQLQEAEKQQEEIINKLRDPVVADFAGIVVKVDAEDGETATAGQVIMTVYDNKNLKTVTYVGHTDARRLEKGQKVNYNLEGMEFRGEVVFIDPVASNNSSLSSDLSQQMEDSFSGMSSLMGMDSLPGVDFGSEPQVKVEMSIEGEDLDELIIGFAINAEVETHAKDNVLTLSAFSLLKEKGVYYLYTLERDNTLQRREVVIGLESALSVEVISGVEEGDLVVLSPSANLETGQLVDAVSGSDSLD